MANQDSTKPSHLRSDLTINASKVLGPPPGPAITGNKSLIELQAALPKWWVLGAPKYRAMRERGETALPKPEFLPDAQDISIPSRDAGRDIPCRLILPDGQSRGAQPGVFLHIHGGGWVLMTEKYQDPFLKRIANSTGLAVVSVGYRLAPEDPFPAGPNDCYDAAEWMVDHSAKEFGAPMMFVGGESAGGHLSALVVLQVLKTRPAFRFKGAVLTYGCFNLSTPFPSCNQFKMNLVLPQETINAYFDAFVPNLTEKQRADPAISPFWHPVFDWDEESLEGRGKDGLPPALFMCGTLDPLLDDSVFMATKWQMAGAEGILRLFRGLPHGFNMFPDDMFPGSGESVVTQCEWMKSKIGA
jgi:acetyl esterase/lipase